MSRIPVCLSLVSKYWHAPDVIVLGGTNASATWDGVIVIDQGIFHFAYSDNLLAYLIGHEMAHHLLRHNDKMSPGSEAYNKIIALRAFFTDLSSHQPSVLNHMMNTQILKNRKMSRDHEFEADEEGMMIMWRAGYNPKACMEFERKRVERDKQLKRLNKNSDNEDNPALWRHPSVRCPYMIAKSCHPII